MSKIKKDDEFSDKTKQKYQVTNWPEYNRALDNRGNITFYIDQEVINNWYSDAVPQRGAQQVYSDRCIEMMMMIKTIFKQPYRQARGFSKGLLRLMGLGTLRVPSHTQLNRRFRSMEIARVVLEERSDLKDLLRIEGRRKQSLPDWLGQVKAFYYNYERVADILVQYNITRDVVDQTRAMIEALEDYRVQQSMSRSHAQEATQQRNKCSRELDKWMSEFMYVAKVALKDHPQYMEALGKTVK